MGLIEVIKKIFKKIHFYYPFTLTGSSLFLVSVYLLIIGFLDTNPYAFILSIVFIFVLIILAICSRIQASQKSGLQIEWDSSIPLNARQEDQKHWVYINGFKVFLFFRVHFKITGKMQNGEGAYSYVNKETFSGGSKIPVSMYFPASGIFSARGRLCIKDVFHLTRASFGKELNRNIIVRPLILSRASAPVVIALDGFENSSKRKMSDEEKYYQREYVPGDRFRDINWKASSRVSELITRVSHITQEKTKTLLVIFRHFRKMEKETLESISHLNYLKAWLLSFLKVIKKSGDDYLFHVVTGNKAFILETMEDIGLFGMELGSLFFQSNSLSLDSIPNPSEVFVFSTFFDIRLQDLLAVFSGAKINLFQTIPYIENTLSNMNEKKVYTEEYKFLDNFVDCPFPGLWAFNGNFKKAPKPYIPNLNGGKLEQRALKVTLF